MTKTLDRAAVGGDGLFKLQERHGAGPCECVSDACIILDEWIAAHGACQPIRRLTGRRILDC